MISVKYSYAVVDIYKKNSSVMLLQLTFVFYSAVIRWTIRSWHVDSQQLVFRKNSSVFSTLCRTWIRPAASRTVRRINSRVQRWRKRQISASESDWFSMDSWTTLTGIWLMSIRRLQSASMLRSSHTMDSSCLFRYAVIQFFAKSDSSSC